MTTHITRRSVLRSAVAAAALSGVGSATGQTDEQTELSVEQWLQYGRDGGRTGYNPDASGPPGDEDSQTELWSFDLGDRELQGPPAVSNGRVVFTTDRELIAVDGEDGSVDWRFGPTRLYGSPAILTAGVITSEVYVGTADGEVIGISMATGEERWRHDTGTALVGTTPLAIRGERLFIAGQSRLTAVNAADQQALWSEPVDAGTAPAAGTETVWSGTPRGMVGRSPAWNEWVLRSEPVTQEQAGEQYVTRDERGVWFEQRSPTVADGTVYLPSRGVTAIDATSGQRKWLFDVAIAVTAPPAVGNGRLYFGGGTDLEDLSDEQRTNAGTVYAVPLDPVEGDRTQLRNRLNEARTGLVELEAAAAEGEEIDQSEVDRLIEEIDRAERDLEELLAVGESAADWTFETDEPINTAPAVTSETVFVVSDAGTVYALDAADGTEKWQYDLDTAGSVDMTAPAVVGDRLYVASQQTGVVALGAADGDPSGDGSSGTDDSVTDGDDGSDGNSGGEGSESAENDGDSTENGGDSDDGSGPGFGVAAGLAGLGGAGYLASRRRSED